MKPSFINYLLDSFFYVLIYLFIKQKNKKKTNNVEILITK